MANKADKEKIVSGEEYRAMSRTQTKSGKQVNVSTRTVGVIIVIIILCIVSFVVGDSYGKDHASSSSVASTTGAGNRSGGGGFRNGGGFGQVTAVSSSSITLQNTRTNASTTYTINSSTTITDSGQTVGVSDIQTGDTVLIRVASTGSTTATSILVNPSFGGGGFGGGGGGGAGSSSSGE